MNWSIESHSCHLKKPGQLGVFSPDFSDLLQAQYCEVPAQSQAPLGGESYPLPDIQKGRIIPI